MEIREFHWLMNIIQNLEVGLVVLDTDNRIQVWNGFMESHSSRLSYEVKDKDLFELYPELDRVWLERKLNMVKTLNNKAFISWEQRPFLFHFSNYRPITGTATHMYQNITIMPLPDFTGEIQHLAILIYDVTDLAVARLTATPA